MDNQKLKKAFSNVKRDILFLKKELENVENRFNSKLNTQLTSITNSLQKIDTLSQDNAQRIAHLKNRDVIIKQHYLPEDVLNEFSQLQKKVNSFEQQLSSSNSSEEITELLQGKLDMEMQNLRMELNENISSVYEKLQQSQNTSHDEKIQNAFDNFSEMIHEKISMETNNIRYEITQEIGKLYDNFFSEIVDLKKEVEQLKKTDTQQNSKNNKGSPLKKTQSKEKSKDNSKSTKTTNSQNKSAQNTKSSKIKKVAHWFLEDEDEDLNSVKKEVKK